MTRVNVDIITAAAHSSDFDRVLEAWPSDAGLTESQLRWKLTQSPYGASWILAATSQSEIAAILVFGRTRIGTANGVLTSGFVYQTYTAPAWRRRGIMGCLLETATKNAREQGFDVLVTLPNQMSIALYERYGFEKVAFLRGWIAPTRKNLLGTLSEVLRGSEFESDPSHQDREYELPPNTEPFSPPVYVAKSVRSPQFVQWRIGGSPQSFYHVDTFDRGFTICRDGMRGTLPERQVLAVHNGEAPPGLDNLREARRGFNGLVSMPITDGPWFRKLMRAGFLPTPQGSPVLMHFATQTESLGSKTPLYLDGLDVHTW